MRGPRSGCRPGAKRAKQPAPARPVRPRRPRSRNGRAGQMFHVKHPAGWVRDPRRDESSSRAQPPAPQRRASRPDIHPPSRFSASSTWSLRVGVPPQRLGRHPSVSARHVTFTRSGESPHPWCPRGSRDWTRTDCWTTTHEPVRVHVDAPETPRRSHPPCAIRCQDDVTGADISRHAGHGPVPCPRLTDTHVEGRGDAVGTDPSAVISFVPLRVGVSTQPSSSHPGHAHTRCAMFHVKRIPTPTRM